MGFFDNPFGGLFDFNRDGDTDMFEAGLGFAVMQELLEEAECEDDDDDFSLDDDYDSLEVTKLQEKLSMLNDKLLDLELEEPDDDFSEAHGRWEERRDSLIEQIEEIEEQMLDL